jgi:prophage antirepressor-like protein
MRKNLQIICQQEVLGKDFKVYGDYENPLFLAKDVAEWIDYNISSVNKMLASVDDDEKTTRKIVPSGSKYQTEAWFLTEDGVYEVLMQSRKPIAKAFKKEVKTILKSIRKHGSYIKEELIDELLKSRAEAERELTIPAIYICLF